MLRILVHDTSYTSDLDRHWVFEKGMGWQSNPALRFVPSEHDQAIQWLRFVNQRNYSHAAVARQSKNPCPIEDYYAFNQSLSRDLNPMDEVFVAMDVSMEADSVLAWQFDHRGTIYEFQLDAALSELRVTGGGSFFQPQTIATDTNILSEPKVRIEFSSIDLQLSVWLNGKAVFRHELEESAKSVSCQPLVFGAAKNQLVFDRIQIWRDLYYFLDSVKQTVGPTTVSPTGFFVIGDNIPISVDSRHWRLPSLPRSEIIGKVISSESP